MNLIGEEVSNAWWLRCSRRESCNGVDDDCDGQVDNIPGTSNPQEGLRTLSVPVQPGRPMQRRRMEHCSGVLPQDEACNGLDDDCDGVSDEIVRPCGPAVEFGNVGECRIGRSVICRMREAGAR